MKRRTKKKGLHITSWDKYDLLDDNKFSGTGCCQRIQVGGSISLGAESVCAFKEGARVGVKERRLHLFKTPSTCKFTAWKYRPVSERPTGDRSHSSTSSACSTFHTKLLCNVNSPQSQICAPPTDTTCFFTPFQNNCKAPLSSSSWKQEGDHCELFWIISQVWLLGCDLCW